MDQRIADFIRDNRRRYNREAITQQLLDAGYSREAIDATWAVLDTPDPDDTAGEGFWTRFILFLVGINAAVLVLVGLSTGSFFTPERLGYLGILLIALGIGALLAWGIVGAVGPTRLGRTTATVIGIVIPLIFALLIGGTCYALLSAFGPPPRSGTLELEIADRPDISGSGTATCYPYGGGRFSIFGQRNGLPYFSVSIVGNPTDGAPRVDEFSISVEPATETDRGESWSTYAAGGIGPVEAEVIRDGLEGSVTFTDLPSDLAGERTEGPTPDPISGTVSWSCN